MINFFRKTRKKLADDNKPLKYMRYAIGEILLVVIGILIALSINNWNQSTNDRVYELKMLTEVKSALENDIDYFQWMAERVNKIDSTINVMSEEIIRKSVFVDSLYLDKQSNWHNLSNTTIFRYNSGPYQAIKSSGIEKISNDSLRNDLIYLYDFYYPFTNELTTLFKRDYLNNMETLKSFSVHIEVLKNNGHYDYIKKYPEE